MKSGGGRLKFDRSQTNLAKDENVALLSRSAPLAGPSTSLIREGHWLWTVHVAGLDPFELEARTLN